MPTLRELGELEVLRRLIAARSSPTGVVTGAGDDAAVLSAGEGKELVATTDAFVEGRHFLTEWSTPGQRGARLAAANLSDLAAMAARPRWGLLSMGLRPDHDMDELLAFQSGVARRLQPWDAGIVGGNLTAVEGREWFDLMLLGEVTPGRAWTRRGARPRDLVAVTGFPGRAAAALMLVRRLGQGARSKEWTSLLRAWLDPDPPLSLALALGKSSRVHAAMDVSDGLGATLAEVVRAGGLAAEIEEDAFTADAELDRACAALGRTATQLRLGPSDDYGLVLAIAPAEAAACLGVASDLRVPLAFVGTFTEGSGVTLLSGGLSRPVSSAGFDSFATGG